MLVVYAGAIPERAVTMQVGALVLAVVNVAVHAVAPVPVVIVPRISDVPTAAIAGPVPQDDKLTVVHAAMLPAIGTDDKLLPISK